MKEQEELLKYILKKYTISPEVVEAYKKTPRHLFIKRFYLMEEMYGDYPLDIYRDHNYISTISQPSFVLLMIDMLRIKPTDKILELGAGSGWNAALMSHLAKKVVSVEIIPALAQQTKENLKELGYKNVEIIEGDAAFGYPAEAPYDKGVFTAGATDLPRAFFEQIKDGGLLLFVLKTNYVDLLLLLEKKGDHFEELERIHCSFVPMRGAKSAHPDGDLDALYEGTGTINIYPNPRKGDNDAVFSVS